MNKISIEKKNCVLFARGCYRNTPLRSRFRMRDFLKPEKHIIFSGHPPEVYWNSHTSVLQCCEVYRHNAKDRTKNDHFVLEIAYTSKILLGFPPTIRPGPYYPQFLEYGPLFPNMDRSIFQTRICASFGSRMKFKTLCYPVFGRHKNTVLPSF